MPKTVDPPPVEVNDSSNRSIIYIVILLCIVTIVSYFMYKVYKKLQVLNEDVITVNNKGDNLNSCLLYTSPSPRDKRQSRMPSSA